MPNNAECGLVEYAKTAPNADMRFFAAAAIERNYSIRTLALKLDVQPSTVVRHMRAKRSEAETIERYAKALGLADRAGRVRRGPAAMTMGDLRYYRDHLLRSIAMADEYADFADASQRVATALDGSKPATQREVLHRFAVSDDRKAAVELLAKRTQLAPPPEAHFTANDSAFWSISLELRDLGITADDRGRVLDFIREKIGRDSDLVRRNDAYLKSTIFGALVSDDPARGAVARNLLSKSPEEE